MSTDSPEIKVYLPEPLKLLPPPYCNSEDLIIENLNRGCVGAAHVNMKTYLQQAKSRGYDQNEDFAKNQILLLGEILRIEYIVKTWEKQKEQQERRQIMSDNKFCTYL
jgi:hypothetical protein